MLTMRRRGPYLECKVRTRSVVSVQRFMLLVYYIAKSVAMSYMCFTSKTIESIADVYFLVTTLYVSARLYTHIYMQSSPSASQRAARLCKHTHTIYIYIMYMHRRACSSTTSAPSRASS